MTEKRAKSRVKVSGNCTGKLVLFEHLEILDLSESGLRMKCMGRLTTNSVQRIRLESEQFMVYLKAVVVRSQLTGQQEINGKLMSVYDVALQFENVSEEQRRTLRRIINLQT